MYLYMYIQCHACMAISHTCTCTIHPTIQQCIAHVLLITALRATSL